MSSLEAGRNLESALMENASSSAIFVAVTSPAYVADEFVDDARARRLPEGDGRGRPGLRHRAFAARQQRRIPAGVCATLKRMAFWQKHPEREIPVTMASGFRNLPADAARPRRADPQAAEEDARGAEGRYRLDCWSSRRRCCRHAPVEASGEGRKIFLAQVNRRSRRGTRAGAPLCRAVRHRGPAGGHYTRRAGRISPSALEADLARADAFVQLLGRTPRQAPARHADGLRPPAVRAGGLRAAADPAVAPARRRSGERHRPRSMRSFSSGENVMRIGPRGLQGGDREARRPRPPRCRRRRASSNSSSSTPTAATCKLAEDLRREFKSANLSAAVPVLQGSSEDVRLDLEENIVECDALVMVYGETHAGLGARPAPPLFKAEASPQAAAEGARALSRPAGIEARHRHGPA